MAKKWEIISKILKIIVAICAIIGVFGGYPGIKHLLSPHPSLGIVALPEEQTGFCKVTIINYGDAATDIKITAFLMMNGEVEQAITEH